MTMTRKMLIKLIEYENSKLTFYKKELSQQRRFFYTKFKCKKNKILILLVPVFLWQWNKGSSKKITQTMQDLLKLGSLGLINYFKSQLFGVIHAKFSKVNKG